MCTDWVESAWGVVTRRAGGVGQSRAVEQLAAVEFGEDREVVDAGHRPTHPRGSGSGQGQVERAGRGGQGVDGAGERGAWT